MRQNHSPHKNKEEMMSECKFNKNIRNNRLNNRNRFEDHTDPIILKSLNERQREEASITSTKCSKEYKLTKQPQV